MTNRVKNFYILSTGRCGTTYISELIRINEASIRNVHQLPDSKWLNLLANIAITNSIFTKIFTAFLFRKYNHILPPSTVDPLKTIAYTIYLRKVMDENPKLIDQVIIIHLVRDPRDFVSSFMNWKNRKISGRIAHHLVPFWMPEPGIRKKIFMSKFEHFCWVWEMKNRFIYETFSRLPVYHRFKIEELKSGTDKLSEFLSLIIEKTDIKTEYNNTKLNTAVLKDFPYWNKWNPEQSKILSQICSNLMEEFDYGKEMDLLNLTNHSDHEK